MRPIIAIAILFLTASFAHAQPLRDLPGWDLRTGYDTSAVESAADMHEPDWSAWIATQMGLDPTEVCEVRTRSNKRVDILSRSEAIEVDWAPKWYEGVGQALFYAIETNREPALLLLVREGDERDAREVLLCQAVCARVGVRLYIQVVPPRPDNRTSYVPPCGEKLHGTGLRSLFAVAG